VAIVDLDAIRHNVRTLRAAAGGAQLCAVVKADAYGHGAVPVARACVEAGAGHLAVSSVEEAEELRAAGVDAPLLLFSEPPIGAIDALLRTAAIPPVYTAAFARAVATAGEQRGRDVPVHLCFDTGMGRVGVERARWAAFLDGLPARGLQVAGTWSHLARADEPDEPTTDEQLDAVAELLGLLADRGIDPGLVHVANSAGTLLHARTHHALGAAQVMVRAGIAVYGLSPAEQVDAADHDLEPALSVTTEVAFAKRVPAGTAVSYGHRWRAPRDGWLATLPIGYADGVPRLLTNRFEALWHDRRHPVVGTVTMDMLHLWCGDERPEVGDEVVLLGAQGGERIRVEDWAHTIGTITYEITCQLTPRLPRVHVNA
jgi:alanine racemase